MNMFGERERERGLRSVPEDWPRCLDWFLVRIAPIDERKNMREREREAHAFHWFGPLVVESAGEETLFRLRSGSF